MKTALTELAGIRHPIVQTGMGWVAGPRLVSATAEAGGLGILASATMSYDELAAAIKEVKSRTSRPFGVNLRADAEDAARRVELLITEEVRVASFALAPKKDMIARLKDNGVLVVPSVGAARHAEKVAGWGADAVIVQGGEGGGHTGGVATTLLLPSVLDAVDIPVVAAGGFFDGRGLAAALAYGAAGVAMGTRFLLTRESTVPDEIKQAYLARDLNGTVVTRKVDGMPHRVLRTELVDALESAGPVSGFARAARNAAKFRKLTGLSWRSLATEGLRMKRGGDRTWSQVLMAANTPMLLRAGLVEGDRSAGVLASGQVVGLLGDLPAVGDLIETIVADATGILRGLASE
ncbi:NAD(P)H-dependent flavin oxidoreductase [Amycolatopsis roodepoortensis]|uniref:NAD(P)H-dependent flavin oxidoreductase YrpB (Nitropropane dioxygenase family) n=1 Tax=Amycolatopsis roodepoortensis TaxID=700274 RepID=A0ABR9LDD6_9PSEU|nr:nitronate monooxygenase [Amycolatopsis roodepoortensis]MBE1578477.1 NAD(P)H-dependent flavin oxidoreductase YrpB (nitropropane dioxygenase family) [Amycolatopsis roodepoortensis]